MNPEKSKFHTEKVVLKIKKKICVFIEATTHFDPLQMRLKLAL